MNRKLRMIPARIRFAVDDSEQGAGTQADDQSTETPQDGEQEPAGDGEQPPAEGGDDDGDDESAKDATYLTKELERTRRESANYRTQLREAQDALGKAKTPEEVEAAVADLTAKLEASETALVRERVLRKHPLPDELAELLQGKDEAELIAHAKKLSKFAPSEEEPDDDARLRGGLDPKDDNEFDAVAEARKARTRRY